MAAPMDHEKHQNKSLIKKFILRNTLIFVVLSILLVIFSNSGRSVDIISHSLVATKCFIILIGLVEILTWRLLVQHSRLQIYSLLKYSLALAMSTVVFHVIAVLYGAPVIESSAETYHFSMLLTVVTILPSCCVLGLQSSTWIRVYALNMPELGAESMVQISSVCSIVGAWLGAFPIPLDWDRPWQVWPVSCVLGTLGGYCVGLVLSISHLYFKTRQRKSKLF